MFERGRYKRIGIDFDEFVWADVDAHLTHVVDGIEAGWFPQLPGAARVSGCSSTATTANRMASAPTTPSNDGVASSTTPGSADGSEPETDDTETDHTQTTDTAEGDGDG